MPSYPLYHHAFQEGVNLDSHPCLWMTEPFAGAPFLPNHPLPHPLLPVNLWNLSVSLSLLQFQLV